MDYKEEQLQEFEALSAIFLDDFVDLATTPASCMIGLSGLDSETKTTFQLKIALPTKYPDEIPVVDIPLRGNLYNSNLKPDLVEHLASIAAENVGAPQIFTLVEEAKAWLEDNIDKYTNVREPVQQEVNKEMPECEADEVKETFDATEGKWDFVIGLVGKPSAGKSTFFNAATKCNKAKVGAHPFTTIEPNFSQAFYSIPDPGANFGVQSEPAYGKSQDGGRYIPLLLKDVAGLVPGASDGKGRGNRFLNDLCDADVLIHVLDASGRTDPRGEPVDAHDPCDDVTWLLEEIHNWIHDNLMRKWEAISRRPDKLPGMFTGYRCSPQLVEKAFARADISTRDLADTLPTWSGDVIRRLVDAFVSVRFPMLLALNKSDDEHSPPNIEKLGRTFPTVPQIPVSSKVECTLQSHVSSSLIKYNPYTGDLTNIGLPESEFQILETAHRNLRKRYGGTNVLHALNQAVGLRHPSYVFPVRDLTTLMSHDPMHKGQSSGVMRDCLVVRPGTTVKHLHTLMLHHYQLLHGNFVRAEVLAADGSSRIVRKEDVLETNTVIKIMTTKKS